MGSFGRTLGVLAFTIAGSLLGPAGFATFGAALGSFAGGLIFAQKGKVNGARLSDLEGETVDYGAPRRRPFGTMKLTCLPIDARQHNGVAQAIKETLTTESHGGIFGLGGVKETKATYSLHAAYYYADGQHEIQRIYLEDSTGKHLKYNRAGATDDERGYELSPVYDIYGRIVGEMGEGIEMWRGYNTQPVSTYLLSQHPDGVPAYRGKSYVVFDGLELKDGLGKITIVAKDLSGDNTRQKIIERTFTEGGVPTDRVWITGLDEPISQHASGGGAVLSGSSARADFLTQIAMLGLCDLPQVDGIIQDRPRQSPLYHVLQLDELGAHEWDGSGQNTEFLKIQPVNVRELPSVLRINFQDPNLDYATNYVVSKRESASHENEQTLELPVASTMAEMQWLCDTLLDEAWAARASCEVTLLPSRINAAVGDILLVPDDSDPLNPVVHSVRISEQTLSPDGLVACKGVFYEGGVYGQYRVIEPPSVPVPAIEAAIAPISQMWDIPSIEDNLATASGALIASCAPFGTHWAGGVWELQNGPASIETVTLPLQSIMGRVLTSHTFTVNDRYDAIGGIESVTLRLELDTTDAGFAPAASELALRRDDANLMQIKGSDGDLCINFYNAVPVSGNPRQWDISGINIGRHGTDALSIPANAPFLLLKDSNGKQTDGPVWVDLPSSLRGETLEYEVVTADKRARSAGVQEFDWNAETLVPRSPVIESAKLDESGNLVLAARARTRYNDNGQKNALARRMGETRTPSGYRYLLTVGGATVDLYSTQDLATLDVTVPAATIGSAHSATLSMVGGIGAGHEVTFTF